jgi:hypothetical protein
VERQPCNISVAIVQQMAAGKVPAVTDCLELAVAGRLLSEKANCVAARRPLGVRALQ